MEDEQPVSGFDPPIDEHLPDGGDPTGDGDVEYVTEWNWPFIGGAVAVVVLIGAVVAFLTLRDGDEPAPSTTTSTVAASTTTQLSAQLSIAELLPLDTQYETLLELLDDGEVADLLAEDGEWTLFAPSTEALEDTTLPSDQSARDALLRRHLVEGALSTRDLADLDGESVTTLSDEQLTIEIGEDRSITVGGATVVKRQIAASNGVIYVVDAPVSP